MPWDDAISSRSGNPWDNWFHHSPPDELPNFLITDTSGQKSLYPCPFIQVWINVSQKFSVGTTLRKMKEERYSSLCSRKTTEPGIRRLEFKPQLQSLWELDQIAFLRLNRLTSRVNISPLPCLAHKVSMSIRPLGTLPLFPVLPFFHSFSQCSFHYTTTFGKFTHSHFQRNFPHILGSLFLWSSYHSQDSHRD